MKSYTQGKRSGPVQMRLFRLGLTPERTPDKSSRDPSLVSPRDSPIMSPPPVLGPLAHSPSALPDKPDTVRESNNTPVRMDATATTTRTPLQPPTVSVRPSSMTSVTSAASDAAVSGTPLGPLIPMGQPPTPNTPASDQNEGWSAVGKATISGRSGRVIERLQSDVDQANRENKALQLSYEELKSSYDVLKMEAQSLRDSMETSNAIASSSESQMKRMNRKMDELKADLAQERSLRQKAESTQASIMAEADQRVATADRDSTKAKEMASYHQMQYEVVSKSFRQLKLELESRVKNLKSEATKATRTMHEHQMMLRKYEAGAEQARASRERAARLDEKLEQKSNELHAALAEEAAKMRAQVQTHDRKAQQLEQEMEETVGAMKHVMNVRQTFKGQFNDTGPPAGPQDQ